MIIMDILKNLSEDLERHLNKRRSLVEEIKALHVEIDKAVDSNDKTRANEFYEQLKNLYTEWWKLTDEFNDIGIRYGLIRNHIN